MDPGTTPFGIPTRVEEMGKTEVPIEMFHEFLHDISDRFTFMTYQIATNN